MVIKSTRGERRREAQASSVFGGKMRGFEVYSQRVLHDWARRIGHQEFFRPSLCILLIIPGCVERSTSLCLFRVSQCFTP